MSKELSRFRVEAIDMGAQEKPAQFIATFSGIEQSQLNNLTIEQQRKVFLGLWKQIDLAAGLHGSDTKQALSKVFSEYFDSDKPITELTQEINSLLVFGDVRDLRGTGVEHLHDRLAHFWRILGWEELLHISADVTERKHEVGSISEVTDASGNLIRTLDLLAERWEEHGVGPHLVFPIQQQRISNEDRRGYRSSRLVTDYTNTLAVVTSRNEGRNTDSDGLEFREKSQLLNQLISRYPIEFAHAIFEYYAFAQEWEEDAYNVGIVQEYIYDGIHKMKGILNGKMVLLEGLSSGGVLDNSIVAQSNNHTVLGSPHINRSVMFDKEIEGEVATVVHGSVAAAIIAYPELLPTFSVKPEGLRKQITRFSKAIGTSKEDKPIITLPIGKVKSEYQTFPINEENVIRAAEAVSEFVTQNGVKVINLEAGHIHADTTPTFRQKKGMFIGSILERHLSTLDIHLIKSTMIDEDHVPNVLDHEAYVALIRQQGFNLDEVIYESSSVIREISVLAAASLITRYPGHFSHEGNALVFNIPDTNLQIEIIKDVTEEPFELGCVIFDVGLTLYKIYPELGMAYQGANGRSVHNEMMRIYSRETNISDRFQAVQERFPAQTVAAQDLYSSGGLTNLPDRKAAIINVLEGFYTPQQQKLESLLRSLGIPIKLIDVTFSNQGLQVHLPQ